MAATVQISKVKLKLDVEEWRLIDWCIKCWIEENSENKAELLITAIAAEMHIQHYKRLIFVKAGQVTFKLSEVIALKRILEQAYIPHTLTNIFRNNLLTKINQEFPMA